MSAASATIRRLIVILCLAVPAAVFTTVSLSGGTEPDPVPAEAAPQAAVQAGEGDPALTEKEIPDPGTGAERVPAPVGPARPGGMPTSDQINEKIKEMGWLESDPETVEEDLPTPEESRVVFEPVIKVDVVSILNRNDEGDLFGFPSAVFCDREMDEILVVTSGSGGRIVIYNENYFPVFSLGAGRGAVAPRDIEKDAAGRFYIVQSATENSPACVSVYNAAMFKERDIALDQPEIEGLGEETFVPQSIAVAPDGRLYITLANVRGVLVMKTDGTFSHWLRPQDMVYAAGPAPANEEEEEKAGEEEEPEEPEFDIDLSTLPEELRPRRSAAYPPEEAGPKLGPVLPSSVRIDSHGNIFVLSAETSKVYVFNTNEELLFSFGEKGGAEGKMSQPRDLVIDENRNAVYIADYMRHTVLIYERSGRFLYEFGGQGNSPGWFMFPLNLDLDRQGHLLVSDLFNMRVQVLNVDFKYRFPLFQVPFVQEDAGGLQPMTWKEQQRYFAPGGFDPGSHAGSGEDGPGNAGDRIRGAVM
ncbi:MAG: NHL repeat-containing protein [Desulfobulbaceae bacterium]|nr:NHL repeat-containing protein [Desulfobulbaceae bacterium]